MSPDAPDSAASPQVTIRFDHIADGSHLQQVLNLLISQGNLLGIIAGEIYALVSDTSTWTLVLTGDIGATVNDHLIGAGKEPNYTTARGAGHVGGITLPNGDGTFEIIVSANVIIDAPDEVADEDLITSAFANARHLGRHEAGHVLLALRKEDSTSYTPDDAALSLEAVGWIDQVSRFMDDFRIERHTRQHAPSPCSHDRDLVYSLEHLDTVLRECSRSWAEDLDAAAICSDGAVAGFIRVLAYLAAEIGLDESGKARRSAHTSDSWDFYAASMWPEWNETFHRLQPVDVAMSRDELRKVAIDLCELAARWSSAIGYERGVTDDGRHYAFWTREQLTREG